MDTADEPLDNPLVGDCKQFKHGYFGSYGKRVSVVACWQLVRVFSKRQFVHGREIRSHYNRNSLLQGTHLVKHDNLCIVSSPADMGFNDRFSC